MSRLEGKTAIITGGASGLGAATARRFVQEGARVAIADLNDELGTALVDELDGSRAFYTRTDVSNLEEVAAMVARVVDWAGTIDVLFNNAGIGGFDRVHDMDPATWERVIAVDLTALFYCCRSALPHMRRPGGAIINNASISGMRGDYANPAYNAAKGGVINFTRSIAVDYGRDGIRANAICPGVIETPLSKPLMSSKVVIEGWFPRIPLQRQGQADEVAALAAFLASDESSYISGAIIPVDGGMTASSHQPNVQDIFTEMGVKI